MKLRTKMGSKLGSKLKPSLWLVSAAIVISVIAPVSTVHAQACTAVQESAECLYGLPRGQYEALLPVMQANPAPGLQAVPVDGNELRRFSMSKVVGDSVPLFNAPGGAQIGTTSPGLTYVAVRSRQGDYAEIEPGKWIRNSDLGGASASDYSGVFYSGQPFPWAWVISYVRPSRVPGQQGDRSAGLVPRLKPVYIFASVQVGRWEWYLIGPGQWIDQRQVARPTPVAPPAGVSGRWVSVDLFEQTLVAYDGSNPVFTTLISTGINPYGTREGVYKVWARQTTDAMSGAMGGPYNLPSVPYVLYFDKDISLHGTYWHDSFGKKKSHGCVNLSVTDARWVFDFTNGSDTFVYVWRSR